MTLDMEKEELEKNRTLRRELIQRRNDGENIIIKNGKIIKRRKGMQQNQSRFSMEQTYKSFQVGNNQR